MMGHASKDPRVVRNRRIIVFTFLIILVLFFVSAHRKLEKERLAAAEAAMAWETDSDRDTVWEAAEKEKQKAESAAKETKENASGAEDDAELTDGSAGLADGDSGLSDGDAELAAGSDTGQASASESLVLHQEDMWCLILTNAEYPIPEDYQVDLKLADVPGTDQSVDERIYEPLMEMLADMKAEGLSPIVCSGFRTLDKQEKLFNRKLQAYVRKGVSKEEAYQMTRQVLSIPGSGEHCLGMAVDFYTERYHQLEEGFEDTPEGIWLREHSQDYGFILRYDRGKEEITGIEYEPWHFRYVGVKAAKYLKEQELSLEEFYIQESLYG